MPKTLTYKILEKHLVEGQLKAGLPIGIRIDQTLTQDATGTTAFLLFESMECRAGQDRLVGQLCGPQYVAVRPGKPQRPSVSADYCRAKRRLSFPSGQRHLPPGASGAVWPARRDAVGQRFTHAHRRGAGDAGDWRRRAGCGRGHGRRGIFPDLPQGHWRGIDRSDSTIGLPVRM